MDLDNLIVNLFNLFFLFFSHSYLLERTKLVNHADCGSESGHHLYITLKIDYWHLFRLYQDLSFYSVSKVKFFDERGDKQLFSFFFLVLIWERGLASDEWLVDQLIYKKCLSN